MQVNDCGGMLLYHGPGVLEASHVNPLPDDVAGITWDGGPVADGAVLYAATISLASGLHSSQESVRCQNPSVADRPFTATEPMLRTELDGGDICQVGRQGDDHDDHSRFTQFGKLLFSDEGAVAVSHHHNRTFAPTVERVLNCWNSQGPLCQSGDADDKPPMENHTLSVVEWYPASIGWPKTGWLAQAVTDGMSAALFSSASSRSTASETSCGSPPPASWRARASLHCAAQKSSNSRFEIRPSPLASAA